jgi:hypothetical protein
VDWVDYSNMHPLLTLWFIVHGCYVIYGHFYPDEVPYVVAHRHAAGNWSQGVLVIKKSAAAKLANIKAHAGIPGQGPGWMGEWFAFWGFWVRPSPLSSLPLPSFSSHLFLPPPRLHSLTLHLALLLLHLPSSPPQGYTWNWNLPNKMLPPMVVEVMGDGAPKSGMYHADGDYILVHSVLFFDALCAHLRFDGVSNLDLIMEVHTQPLARTYTPSHSSSSIS